MKAAKWIELVLEQTIFPEPMMVGVSREEIEIIGIEVAAARLGADFETMEAAIRGLEMIANKSHENLIGVLTNHPMGPMQFGLGGKVYVYTESTGAVWAGVITTLSGGGKSEDSASVEYIDKMGRRRRLDTTVGQLSHRLQKCPVDKEGVGVG